MKELTNEQYKEYDQIVASSSGMVQFLIDGKDKISVTYKEDTINRYFLKIVSMVAGLNKKKVYIKTDIITYIKLKKKLKNNIRFSFSAEIDTERSIICLCEALNIRKQKIEEVYNVYYNN